MVSIPDGTMTCLLGEWSWTIEKNVSFKISTYDYRSACHFKQFPDNLHLLSIYRLYVTLQDAESVLVLSC